MRCGSKKRKLEVVDDALPGQESDERGKKAGLDAFGENDAQAKKHLTLLGLPGELCNRIYDFILLGVRDRTVYDKLTEKDRVGYPRKVRDTGNPPILDRPEHMSDLHVCRRIRLEFRLLYQARHHVLIPGGLLDNYLEAFGQDGVEGITVLDRPLSPMDESVNLLLLFISGSPALKIELEPRVPAMKPGLYFTLPMNPLPVHIRKTRIFVKSLIRKGIIAHIRISMRQVTEESTKPNPRRVLLEQRLLCSMGPGRQAQSGQHLPAMLPYYKSEAKRHRDQAAVRGFGNRVEGSTD